MVDEFFVANKTMTPEEIQDIMAVAPTNPSILDSLVLYWSFETVSATAPYNVLGDYGTPIKGRVVESPGNLLAGLFGPAIRPVRPVSGAAFLGSGALAVQQPVSGLTSAFNLSGPQIGVPQITSLPSGQIRLILASGAIDSAPVSVTPTPAPYGVEYTGTWVSVDSFAYTIAGEQATVQLLPNTPPTPPANMSVWVDQNTDFELFLARKTYYPPSSMKQFDWYQVDADANDFVCTLESLPQEGVLLAISYDNDENAVYTEISASDLPATVHDCIVEYSPPPGVSGDDLATFNVTVSDGIATAKTVFHINVVNHYYPPAPSPISVLVQENTNYTISFRDANLTDSFSVFQNGGTVVDSVWVEIDRFPRLGRLFQASSGMELLANSPPQSQISSWASEVVAVSSEYIDPTGWGRRELLGENNCFPSYGDCPQSWQTEFANADGWFVRTTSFSSPPARLLLMRLLLVFRQSVSPRLFSRHALTFIKPGTLGRFSAFPFKIQRRFNLL